MTTGPRRASRWRRIYASYCLGGWSIITRIRRSLMLVWTVCGCVYGYSARFRRAVLGYQSQRWRHSGVAAGVPSVDRHGRVPSDTLSRRPTEEQARRDAGAHLRRSEGDAEMCAFCGEDDECPPAADSGGWCWVLCMSTVALYRSCFHTGCTRRRCHSVRVSLGGVFAFLILSRTTGFPTFV